MKHVAEIEWIEPAGDADGVELSLLDCDAPGAAPGQRAEPHFSLVFTRCARLDGEPRVGLVTRCTAPALTNAFTRMERFLGQVPFARPAARQVIQGIACRRHRPGCGGRLFDR